MSHSLYLLGRACFRARRRVLVGWLLVLAVLGGTMGAVGTDLDESFSIPGTPAQVALDDLERTFPQTAAGAGQVVVTLDEGDVTDDDVRSRVEDGLTEIAGMDGVAGVSDPYTGDQVTPAGEEPVELPDAPEVVDAVTVSDDGSALYAQVQFDDAAPDVPAALADDITEAMSAVGGLDGASTYFGGEVFAEKGTHMSPVELVGVLIALLVLAWTFRSFVAALLPIGTAIIGVGVAMLAFLLSSNVIEVSSSAPSLGMMIGLAVGIDYALFIVSRYRELLADGRPLEEAAARATATAGSAVVFAGATVVIALAGLSIAQIPFLTVMGIGAAFAVVVAVVIALTLLPALLGMVGERLRPRPHHQTGGGAVAARWSRIVRRGRWPAAVGAVAVLVACALPSTDLRLALPDNGDQEAGTSQRLAYDTVAEEFGPGYNGPLTVSANILGSTDPLADIDDIATDLAAIDGVEAVTTAVPNEGADTAVFSVVPEGAPDDPATADLVTELRDLAESDELTGFDLAVTGPTAVALDVSERLASALVPFGAVVVGLSLLLLMLVFRSVLVPLTASVGYLLSTAASFGVVALVFEHGFAASLVGVDQTGPVVSFLPIMLMGVLFGLAMDYQVFLVSRMHEHHTHHPDAPADEAVDAGIRQSSKVVVAAAVIMVAVFAAFVPTGDAVLKPIAFALAVGVLLDAFVVRLLLIPALMTILGKHAWWLPRWLGERLPELDVEGAHLEDELAREAQDAPEPGALVSLRGIDGVDDVDLHAGELLVVPGPRAVGRDLLWAIAGRTRPRRGEVYVVGEPARHHTGHPVVGIGGVAGLPARSRSLGELASAESAYGATREVLRGEADRLGLQHDELVDNLAWGLAAAPPVVVVELPCLPADQEQAAWSLLQGVAAGGTALVVAVESTDPDVHPFLFATQTLEVTR